MIACIDTLFSCINTESLSFSLILIMHLRASLYGFLNSAAYFVSGIFTRLLALNNWESWRKGELLNHLEIKNIYEYLGSNVLEGFRKGKTLHSDDKYKLEDCQQQHGLIVSTVWYEAFEGLDPMTENYIRNMRANGETLNRNPRIIMSTIHGAKGGEADKVLLMQDLTNAALETFSHDPDELHRLFYTGATRAKRELHVLDPKNFDRAYII